MTAVNIGLSCSKFVLIIFNTLFIVIGGTGFGLGLWILNDSSLGMAQLVQTDIQSPNCKSNGLIEAAGNIMVVAGATIVIIGLLGFFGVYLKKRWMLYIYGGSLLLIFTLEIATIITASVFEDKIEVKLKHLLKDAINSTYDGNMPSRNRFTASVNYAQIYFDCCGVDSYTNFHEAEDWDRTSEGSSMLVPPACCKLTNKHEFLEEKAPPQLLDDRCPTSPSHDNSNKDTPCWRPLMDYFDEKVCYIVGLAAAVIVPEILCFISAFCIIGDLPQRRTHMMLN